MKNQIIKIFTLIVVTIGLNTTANATFCTYLTGDNCTNADASNTGGGMGISANSCTGGNCQTTFGANVNNCNGTATGNMYFMEFTNSHTCGALSLDMNSVSGDNTQATVIMFTDACLSSSWIYDVTDCMSAGDNLTSNALASGESLYIAIGAESGECIDFDIDVSNINLGSPPSNDDCSSPTALTSGNGIDAGGGSTDALATTTNCATETCTQTLCTDGPSEDCFIYNDPPSCGLGNMSGGLTRCWGSIENSVYYTLTPPATDTYYIHLLNQACSTNGLQFMISSTLDCSDAEATSTGMLTDVNGDPACYNQNTTADIYIEVDLTGGTTYYIIVDGFAGAQCNFDLVTGTILLLDVDWGKAYAKEITDSKAELNWNVKGDKSNSDFVVYAARNVVDVDSEDTWNLDYKEIGRVSPNGEEGRTSYKFIDEGYTAGTNYYYVAKLDKEGREATRSKGIALHNITNFGDMKVLSNPVTDQIRFTWNQNLQGKVSLNLVDMSGKIVMSETNTYNKGAQQYSRNTSDLNNGVYIISLKDESGNEVTERIIIKK